MLLRATLVQGRFACEKGKKASQFAQNKIVLDESWSNYVRHDLT